MFTNRIFGVFAALLMAVSLPVQAGVNIQQWKTTEGTPVYFIENHDLPIVDVSVNFRAGGAYDPSSKVGVASLTRYLMTLGAAGLTDEEIAKRMADVGALLGGDFDADRASIKLRSLSSKAELDQALDIYMKVLQKPDFPEAVLSREKARVIAGIKEASTQPASIGSDAFLAALYPAHPYGLINTPESVAAITRADLQQFYQRYYSAPNAVIALIGDMTRVEAEALAGKIAAGLPVATGEPVTIPPVAYPAQAVERRIAHPAKQSHILLGYPGVKRGDADYFPLYVGNYILGGGGFVSRLTEEVREKRGLVYSVYSYFLPMAELGQFQIGLQTKREQSSEALALVKKTLADFIAKGVTATELNAAKQNITGGFPLRLDSNAKLLDYLSVIGFYQLPLTYLDDFNARVNAVTAAQIQDAFSRRIDPDKLVTVIVAGD